MYEEGFLYASRVAQTRGLRVAPFDVVMEDRATKIARVGLLRRRPPHMSQSALAAILTEAKREPLPLVTRRDDLRMACNAIADLVTPYGRVHQQIPLAKLPGTVWLVEIASVAPMLYMTAASSAWFSRIISETIARQGQPTPQHPWGVVLYIDEVDPSDALAGVHGRKFQACYWSILELGAAALCHEELWFTMCTARSNEVNSVVGGASALFDGLIRHSFLGAHDLTRAGLFLVLHDGSHVRIFLRFDTTLADGDALRAINCTRGSGGEMPCNS